MNYKVLYNPLAGNVNDTTFHAEITKALEGDALELYDITKTDYERFFADLKEGEGVIVAGGDGTLNRYINDTLGMEISAPVYYYAAGNGNDFWTDIGRKKGDKPVELAPYIKDLPTVTVNGKDYKFVNGVGFGIDGYCCEVGDRLKAANKNQLHGHCDKGTAVPLQAQESKGYGRRRNDGIQKGVDCALYARTNVRRRYDTHSRSGQNERRAHLIGMYFLQGRQAENAYGIPQNF